MIVLLGSILAGSASEGITFDDALERAVVAAPAVAEAEARVDAARADVGLARAWPDPTIAVGTTRYSARTTLAAELPLPRASYGSTLHAAAADREAALADRVRTEAELRARVARAWTELWAAEQRRRLAEESVADARAVRDAAAARTEAGEAPRTERLAAESAFARAAADATGSEADRRGAGARLASLLRLQGDLQTIGDPGSEPIGDIEALRATLNDHPTHRADVAAVEASAARRRAATADWIPELSVGVEVDEGDPGLPGTDVLAHVGLTLPLGGATGPGVAAAAARERAAEAHLEADDGDREGELVSAWYAWDAARSRLTALDEQALPLAIESAELAREAYAAGETDLLTLLVARTEELSARSDRIDAVVALAFARSDLVLAAGVTDAR